MLMQSLIEVAHTQDLFVSDFGLCCAGCLGLSSLPLYMLILTRRSLQQQTSTSSMSSLTSDIVRLRVNTWSQHLRPSDYDLLHWCWCKCSRKEELVDAITHQSGTRTTLHVFVCAFGLCCAGCPSISSLPLYMLILTQHSYSRLQPCPWAHWLVILWGQEWIHDRNI